jgi:hypothetical protein
VGFVEAQENGRESRQREKKCQTKPNDFGRYSIKFKESTWTRSGSFMHNEAKIQFTRRREIVAGSAVSRILENPSA